MVTRDILYLTIDTFFDIVVKSNFPLLSVGWYLFRVVSGNRYLPRGSNENDSLNSGKSFRENSIVIGITPKFE